MSTFTNITVEDYTNHKSDGKKLKKLQEHVPELQGRINTLAEEYRRELAVEKARAEAAELALSEAVATEKSRAEGIEEGLRTDLGTEESARIAGDLAEKTRAELAETALGQRVTDETTRAMGVEAGLSADLDAEVLARAAETTRAMGIEQGLRDDLGVEEQARVAGDLTEKNRAEAAELGLSQAVSAEEARAIEIEGGLRTDLDAIVAQQSSDQSGQSAVTSAIVTASGLNADGTFPNHAGSNYMSTSVTAHASRERLDTALGYTDQMLGAHSGAPGVFTVSVGAKNAKTYSVDSEGNESYSSAGLTVKQAAINLSGAIDREKARAEAAEAVALAGRRQIESDFAQADGEATTDRGRIRTEMASAVGVEKSRAESAEAVLQANLVTEAADRLNADTAAGTDRQLIRTELAAAVQVEDTRAKAAEAALSTRVDNILHNTDPAQIDSLSEMLSAFQAADGDLSTTITALTTTQASDKAELQASITTQVGQSTSTAESARETLKSELEQADGAIMSAALDIYDSFDRKEYAYDSSIVNFSGTSPHIVDNQVMKWESNFTKDPEAPESIGFLGQKRSVKIAGKLFCPAGYKLKIYYDDVSSQVAFEELEFGQEINNQFEHNCEFYFGASMVGGKVPVAMSDKFKTYANTFIECWGQMADLEFSLTANRMVFRVRYEFVLDGSVASPAGTPSFTVYAREQTIDHYANKHPDNVSYFNNSV